MQLKLENGKRYTPKDSDKVECHEHGFVTTWGALDPFQQLAVSEGLDTVPESRCLLRPKK